MANIVAQNPKSSEIQSPLIAGLSEGLNKISAILNLGKANLSDYKLTAVAVDNSKENKNRIYEAESGKRLWLVSPAVVVKKNGVTITPSTIPFTIDYVGGSITFDKPLLDEDVIFVTAEYITGDSTTINTLSNVLQQVKTNADRYKGYFDTEGTLKVEHPTASNGDIAFVEKPNFAIFAWDGTQNKWRNTQSIEDLKNYYTQEQVNAELAKKESTINGDGKANSYYGGDKKWHDVNKATRDTKLEGLSVASKAPVTASDSVIGAVGKLQAQATDSASKHFISGTGEPTTSTVGEVGQRYTNTSNGDVYICAGVTGNSYTWNKLQKAENGKGLYPSDKPVTDNNYSNEEKNKVSTIKDKVATTTFEAFKLDNTKAINARLEKTTFEIFEKENATALSKKVENSDFEAYQAANTEALSNKVDKQSGMGLYPMNMSATEENFTTAEKSKLSSLKNYDDTTVKSNIETLENADVQIKADIENLKTGKADKTEVTDALKLKADTTTVNAELANKADKTALDLKADKTEVENKADTTTVNAELVKKADKTTVETNTTSISNNTTAITNLNSQVKKMAVVDALPAAPDATTLYFIKEV